MKIQGITIYNVAFQNGFQTIMVGLPIADSEVVEITTTVSTASIRSKDGITRTYHNMPFGTVSYPEE